MSTSEAIQQAMRQSAAVLRDAGIPYALAGGLAAWARGGVDVDHDVDFVILPQDVDRALAAFRDAGHRVERPVEEWLCKAWVDGVLVDLIFVMAGESTGPLIDNSETLEVAAVQMHVMTATDVLVAKLNSLTEQAIELHGPLQVARALREQIDWELVSTRTKRSALAKAFITLVDELGISSN